MRGDWRTYAAKAVTPIAQVAVLHLPEAAEGLALDGAWLDTHRRDRLSIAARAGGTARQTARDARDGADMVDEIDLGGWKDGIVRKHSQPAPWLLRCYWLRACRKWAAVVASGSRRQFKSNQLKAHYTLLLCCFTTSPNEHL